VQSFCGVRGVGKSGGFGETSLVELVKMLALIAVQMGLQGYSMKEYCGVSVLECR